MPHDVEQHLVEPGELVAHHPSDGQQRLNDGGKPGQTFDQLAKACLKSSLSDSADLQAEVAQGAAQIGIDVEHLACTSLRAVSSMRFSWLASVFTCTGFEQAQWTAWRFGFPPAR